ncbi:MAG: hypothetical protein HC866_17535 [Leptolyngbyaceae cyanobacterium RU_5_1]|nr:hypothetical protein [Leptolyngbyaceae cyanobacterium RU_5_1]
MNPQDPIILVIYLVCMTYAIVQIIKSFDDEYTVALDKDALKQQLESHNLQDDLEISFGFEKRYEFSKSEAADKLKKFGISVKNKLKDRPIYVDWDYSAMTDLEGRSRRITRLVPGNTLDVFQYQAFNTVAPETTLKETITAEDVLKRKDSEEKVPIALQIDIDKPLLDFAALNKPKASETNKRRYARFVKRVETLDFSMNLAIRRVGSAIPESGHRTHIHCTFILTKLPWLAALPWNPKD